VILSFSQWSNYSECPRRWSHKYIDKLATDPAGPAAERGSIIHDQTEQYIKKQVDTPVAKYHNDVLERFRNAAVVGTEAKYYFDDKWYPTAPKSATAAYVVVFDAYILHPTEVEIGEWKTGKPKDEHAGQREIYALAGHRQFGLPKVTATTYYLDGTAPPDKLTMHDTAVKNQIIKWQKRREQMMEDTFWPPRPGYYCRWCSFSKTKGGPCQFSG